MGCATSKEAARKRAERESWYAPVSRSISAPIHYPAETEEDSCHVVTLASSSYGTMEMEKPGEPMLKGSFVRILGDKVAHVEHNDASMDSTYKDPAMVKSQLKGNLKLKPVQEEVPENEHGDLETINTWELMEGLDEDGGRAPPLGSSTTKPRSFEKSLSFNTVLELDSCSTEVGSPVWKKYYLHEADVNAKAPSLGQRRLGSSHHSSQSFGGAEEQLFNGYAGYSGFKSPEKSSIKTPSKSLERSPMKSPLKSPMMEPSSPLFDPSLMATFEQALQSIALPQDDWMLMQDANEESITNSSASSSNQTWLLSDTSSDAESPQSELVVVHTENSLHSSSVKREMSSKVTPWNGDFKMINSLHPLESFEPRCPPRGEEKVVFYFTSLRGIRKTYEDCCELRIILRGLGVHVDERDVWMHSKFREELTEVLGSKHMQVPQLFIKGRYIGGADDVRQLHEDGVLNSLIEDLPCLGLFRKVCEGCADVRFMPCLTCSGSCKVLDDMDQTVRCDKCNENGLIMCPLCS